MQVLFVFLTTFLLIDGQDQVCYANLGCFSMEQPWLSPKRPVPPPDPPEAQKIRAFFFNRDNPDYMKIVSTWPKIDLYGAGFNNTKWTFFIIHGFETTGSDVWLQNMKIAILNKVDANVFIGDWGNGAKGVNYFQAVSNVRVAARQFSNLIHFLIDQRGLNVSRLHLIAHSLGAQLAGMIGKSIPNIYRITGMDPGQACFEGFPELVRLTRNDAVYVDIIHADARPFIPDLGFGIMNAVGDVDFYVNAGHGQPGCSFPKLLNAPKIQSLSDFVAIPNELFRQTLLCPHGLSHEFVTESINDQDCVFWGHNASMANMLRGISNAATEGFFSKYLGISEECTYETCSPMGLYTFDWPARGSFVVSTRGNFPYCIYERGLVPVKDQERFVYGVQKQLLKYFRN